MSDPDYTTWLTKAQAAEAIGVTTKTVERFVQAGQIQQARWQREGRGPLLAVYQPDDVARLASARRQGPLPPFVVPASAGPANGNGHHGADGLVRQPRDGISRFPDTASGEDLLRALVAAAMKVMSQTSETPTVYVGLREASVIAGLPQADLRRLIDDGDLNCRRTGRGGIRIRRKDLEAL